MQHPRRGGPGRALDDSYDRALLERHAAGDRAAFSELFSRHRGRLWAVALRTCGDPEEAADALQDAAVSAFRAAADFRGEAAVGTWLYRIVVNACIDRARRQAARPTVRYPDEASPAWQRATREPSDMAANRDLRMMLEQALAELPYDQRAAIVAVDVEGLSVDEAARALGIPPGTVKSRCARGRAKLAILLADLRNHTAEGAVQTGKASPAQDAAPAGGAPEITERGVR